MLRRRLAGVSRVAVEVRALLGVAQLPARPAASNSGIASDTDSTVPSWSCRRRTRSAARHDHVERRHEPGLPQSKARLTYFAVA